MVINNAERAAPTKLGRLWLQTKQDGSDSGSGSDLSCEKPCFNTIFLLDPIYLYNLLWIHAL